MSAVCRHSLPPSPTSFHTISNRFVKELTETSILVKDTKLELILTGMRFLRLKVVAEWVRGVALLDDNSGSRPPISDVPRRCVG